jgi:monoamine oxidase
VTPPFNPNSPYRHVRRTPRFSWERLFAHPGPLRDYDARGDPKRVCVIGGGIAGLTAAYELSRPNLDHTVVLLESSDRCGGRIETHVFKDGTYGELGAMRLPGSHGCVHEYLDEFTLATRPFVMDNEAAWLHFRGEKKRRRDWPDLADILFPDLERADVGEKVSLDPAEVMSEIARRAWDLLDDNHRWKAFDQTLGTSTAAGQPTNLSFAEEESRWIQMFEGISLWQYVTGRDWQTFSALPPPAPLRDAEWEYLARVTTNLPWERVSFLEWLIAHNALRNAEMREIEGGMERLVDAFVTRLGDRIHCNSCVRRLAVLPEGVRVEWDTSGERKSDEFHYVICTTPARATAAIAFDPRLPAHQYEALTNISYFPAAKTLIHCKSRRWEWDPDEGIYGGGSRTDLPHQQSWYPSDNAKEPPESVEHFRRASPEESDGGSASTQSLQWEKKRKKAAKQPGVFLAAYMWGPAASHFGSLGEDERTDLILASVEQVHPWIRDELTEVVHRVWDVGGGGFLAFAPGERLRYQAALAEPYPEKDAKVFFAGEHLGILHGWIQAAIQTALAAAIRVLESPPPNP